MLYHTTFQQYHDYELSDGTILRAGHDSKTGRLWFEATRNGKTHSIRNADAFLATLNADVAKQLLPRFQAARTPEQIIALSQEISSTRGRNAGPEVTDTYRTPDGRKYRVTYYAGQMTEWGFV